MLISTDHDMHSARSLYEHLQKKWFHDSHLLMFLLIYNDWPLSTLEKRYLMCNMSLFSREDKQLCQSYLFSLSIMSNCISGFFDYSLSFLYTFINVSVKQAGLNTCLINEGSFYFSWRYETKAQIASESLAWWSITSLTILEQPKLPPTLPLRHTI